MYKNHVQNVFRKYPKKLVLGISFHDENWNVTLNQVHRIEFLK